MSVTGSGKQSIKVTSERCHDGPVYRVGKWIEGTLLLFDLGYYRCQLFSCIRRNGGFFVSRLKTNANLTLLHEAPDSNATCPGLLDSVETGAHRYRPRAVGPR